MTSIQNLKKQVKELKDKAEVDREGIAWLKEDGTYSCDGQHFQTKDEFNNYVVKMDYTKMYMISWEK